MTIDFSLFQNKQQELLTSCLMKSLHICWDADVMWTLQDLKLALRNICGNGNTEIKCVQFRESTWTLFFQLCWCVICECDWRESFFVFFLIISGSTRILAFPDCILNSAVCFPHRIFIYLFFSLLLCVCMSLTQWFSLTGGLIFLARCWGEYISC